MPLELAEHATIISKGMGEVKSRPLRIHNLENSNNDFRGTFADNYKVPIHRWYRYPCGFSHSLVEECFKTFNVVEGNWVLDPFAGCGTTSVCAKMHGINSWGVEAHFYVAWIASVKTFWDFDIHSLKQSINELMLQLWSELPNSKTKVEDYRIKSKPEFLRKIFSEKTLCELYVINDLIEKKEKHFRDLSKLALASVIRKVSDVGTVFPYVLPRKKRKTKPPEVFDAFNTQLTMMYNDLCAALKVNPHAGEALIKEGDSTKKLEFIDEDEADFAFTSPPYLNNVDYADATRLDMYFFGLASNWKDITEKVRNKLLVSATTQVGGKGLKERLLPRDEIIEEVRNELIQISNKLREVKQRKGGKKDYDVTSIGYFNDMYLNLNEVYRCLRPNGFYCLILGDSAPYGIHIATDVFLSKIALGIGFTEAKIKVLRERGGKWKSIIGTRRHNVPLRESLIILKK